jgi:hypothetical protein
VAPRNSVLGPTPPSPTNIQQNGITKNPVRRGDSGASSNAMAARDALGPLNIDQWGFGKSGRGDPCM